MIDGNNNTFGQMLPSIELIKVIKPVQVTVICTVKELL